MIEEREGRKGGRGIEEKRIGVGRTWEETCRNLDVNGCNEYQ